MPDLNSFDDVDELDNRYIGKCVVYVEGEDDRNAWEHVVGSDVADRLEFKVPRSGGAWAGAVLCRVRAERVKNTRIFGLVDGEVAAEFGETARLIECPGLLFELGLPDCEGIVFIAAHELENILIGQSGFVEFVEHNLELRELGSRTKEEIKSHVSTEAHRFYVAALVKYAWAHLHFKGLTNGLGDVGHFRSRRSLLKEIREARQRVRREFSDGGGEFRRQLGEIGRRAKQRIDDVERGGGCRVSEVVRLSDGKGLLARLRNHWQLSAASNGQLVERVRVSTFGTRFRDELLAVTRA